MNQDQEKILIAEKFGSFYNNLDGQTKSFVGFILGEIWPEFTDYSWAHIKEHYIQAGAIALQILAPGSSVQIGNSEEEPGKIELKATIDHSRLAYYITKTFH